MYERIVVGTDLSRTARVATDRAAALAAHLGAQLTLVHAGADLGEEFTRLGDEYGAETVTRPGSPAEVLIDEADSLNADLLVVGSVGMSGARRFLLGSVPNKVSHHANCDLLIVKTNPPPREIGTYHSILVGTDGSPTAMQAVEKTAQLAAGLDISPTVVCVYEPLTEEELDQLRRPGDALSQWNAPRKVADMPEEFKWRISGAAQAEDVLERAAERAAKVGVDAEVRAIRGNPAEKLIEAAEEGEFDLIVVGSVGMSGPKRFMLGNVPHRISHHAPTDVLILHTA